MTIQARNLGGAAKTATSNWLIPLTPTDATEHINALSITGQAVGFVLTGSSFYTKTTQSIFITTAALDNTISLTITGYNQFNELVTEVVSLAAGSQTAQSVLCYRRVTSITITAAGGAFGADDTVSVGYSMVAVRAPFQAKVSSGAILRVTDLGQAGTQPTFTAQDVVSGQPRHNIVASAVTVTGPFVGVTVDPTAVGL